MLFWTRVHAISGHCIFFRNWIQETRSPCSIILIFLICLGEHGSAPRGQQLRQPEGAADGLAQAGARPLQGQRAGADQGSAPGTLHQPSSATGALTAATGGTAAAATAATAATTTAATAAATATAAAAARAKLAAVHHKLVFTSDNLSCGNIVNGCDKEIVKSISFLMFRNRYTSLIFLSILCFRKLSIIRQWRSDCCVLDICEHGLFPCFRCPDGQSMEGRHAARSASVPDVEGGGGEELGRRAPAWVPDTASPGCQECRRTFSFLVRRHHCRCATNNSQFGPICSAFIFRFFRKSFGSYTVIRTNACLLAAVTIS